MSGQRLGLFLTKHHQYKHEDFLRADSQYLCKRRAMNKSFAIIYISNILENINHKQRQVCVFYINKKGD